MQTTQGRPTETGELRKFLHDLANALNAAKINAYLLRRIHGDVLDRETVDGLDSSLYDAEKLVGEYHRRVHAEITSSAGSKHEAEVDGTTATK
jgi:hypothetical protein